ncbi:MAG: tyrosine-type recombinase/integrase [Rhodoferax sp.]
MLTDMECRKVVCPEGKKYIRLSDAGSLYLQVDANGSKRWFFKYTYLGKSKLMALGKYPAVGLTVARRLRDEAKLLKATGVDPMEQRKIEKLKAMNPSGETFKAVAQEWLAKQVPQWSDVHAKRCTRQLERDLYPYIGDRKINDLEPVEVLAAVRKTEQRGALETAERGMQLVGQIFRYAVATGRAPRDVTADLKGALTPYRSKHFGAITDPTKLGELMRAIGAYRGGPIVRTALQLAPILFQRPGELRAAAWAEVDLENAVWTIPSARMKRTKEGKENGDDHLVPLPTQAIELLKPLKALTGHGRLVFPGERDHDRPISDNSVRTALLSLGYSSDLQTWHGFRATARTMLAERLDFDINIIEAQLAHAVRDANGTSYNRTKYLEQRTKMMQSWADYLDALAAGAKVISLKAA